MRLTTALWPIVGVIAALALFVWRNKRQKAFLFSNGQKDTVYDFLGVLAGGVALVSAGSILILWGSITPDAHHIGWVFCAYLLLLLGVFLTTISGLLLFLMILTWLIKNGP